MFNGKLIEAIGILILGMSLCIGLMFYKSKPISPDVLDAGQYVSAAYNIFHHRVFSESVEEEIKPPPRVGREPFYSLVLSSILYFEPAASGITAKCLSTNTLCPEDAYILGKWLNGLLFALAGAAAAILGWLVSRSLFAGTIAGFAIWANFSAQKNMFYMVSDPLALALSSFLALTLYLAIKRGDIWFWAASGLLLSFLTLTKAIFLYFIPLPLLILLVVLMLNKKDQSYTLRISICLVFIGCLILPLHSWMQRNQAVSDQYVITMERSGIALNTRDRLNEMSWPEYAASFIYWIRGSGDSMAARLFPKEHWDKLRVEHPEGYYLTAQLGYPAKVREVMANSEVSQTNARNIVDKAIIANILERPLKHLVVNIAVFWRGIWVDEFIIFSLPGLISLVIWATRNGNLALIMALTPSLFNLLIYPTISLNVPRYQITALPALSLGTMFTIIWITLFFRRKWGRQ